MSQTLTIHMPSSRAIRLAQPHTNNLHIKAFLLHPSPTPINLHLSISILTLCNMPYPMTLVSSTLHKLHQTFLLLTQNLPTFSLSLSLTLLYLLQIEKFFHHSIASHISYLALKKLFDFNHIQETKSENVRTFLLQKCPDIFTTSSPGKKFSALFPKNLKISQNFEIFRNFRNFPKISQCPREKKKIQSPKNVRTFSQPVLRAKKNKCPDIFTTSSPGEKKKEVIGPPQTSR
jgi:hypothetical protein